MVDERQDRYMDSLGYLREQLGVITAQFRTADEHRRELRDKAERQDTRLAALERQQEKTQDNITKMAESISKQAETMNTMAQTESVRSKAANDRSKMAVGAFLVINSIGAVMLIVGNWFHDAIVKWWFGR
jgi:chromosome segregation ATPase